MKSINNNPLINKWKKTLLLIGILILVTSAGVTALVFLNRSSELDMRLPYEI